MIEMRQSWLIQRLTRPLPPTVFGRDNPFAFGGGRRNGGLSDEAMDVLRPVFQFDYMGAAEFEFGAVPKALQTIATSAHDGRLGTRVVDIELKKVPPNWSDKTKVSGLAPVYLLADAEWLDEIAKRVRDWAYKGHRSHTKESVRLSAALRPYDKWDHDTQGWLELDNGFFFFTDREMFTKTAEIFGVTVDSEEETA